MSYRVLDKPGFHDRPVKYLNINGRYLSVAVPTASELKKLEEVGSHNIARRYMLRVQELNTMFPMNPYSMLCQQTQNARNTFNWFEKTNYGPVKKMRQDCTVLAVEQFKLLKKVFNARYWNMQQYIDRTLSLEDFSRILDALLQVMSDESIPPHHRNCGLPEYVDLQTWKVFSHPQLELEGSYVPIETWISSWRNFLVSEDSVPQDKELVIPMTYAQWCEVFVSKYGESKDDQKEDEVLTPVVYPEGPHLYEQMTGRKQVLFPVKAEARLTFSLQFDFESHYLEHYVKTFNETLAPAGVKVVLPTSSNFATVQFDDVTICDGYPAGDSLNFDKVKDKAVLVDHIYRVLVHMHRVNRQYKDMLNKQDTSMLEEST